MRVVWEFIGLSGVYSQKLGVFYQHLDKYPLLPIISWSRGPSLFIAMDPEVITAFLFSNIFCCLDQKKKHLLLLFTDQKKKHLLLLLYMNALSRNPNRLYIVCLKWLCLFSDRQEEAQG